MASSIKYDRTAVNGLPPTVNPFGKKVFVDGTNGNNAGGLTPQTSFLTIQLGLAAMDAGDTMVIAPGTYTIVASFTPLANQRFQAAIVNPQAPTVIITATSALTGDMIPIDVSGTYFQGIKFLAGHANQATIVDIADLADVNGITFDSCEFNGADKTSVVAIQLDDATFIPTGLLVTNCTFRNFTGTVIDVGVKGMAFSRFAYNTFSLDVASGTIFALADTTTLAIGKGWVIEHNDFFGFDTTGAELAITVAGTEGATGMGLVRNNYGAWYAAATFLTIDKMGKGVINNYVAAVTGGGTIVTTGT